MKILMKYISILAGVLFFCTSLSAQNSVVKSVLDTSSILIGDQTKVHLMVECDEKANVVWPQIGDTLRQEIEVIHKTNIDTTALANGRKSYSQALTITSFDSGYFAIPPFRFRIDVDGLNEEIETMAHLLEVHTVAVDTTGTIKEIKPIHSIPLTFGEVFPWALGGLALLAIIVLLWSFIRRRKSNSPLPLLRKKPEIPAHRAALDDLEKLKAAKLWQQGALKEYYSGITDILRVYLEKQFSLHAVELSSSEIIDQVVSHPILNGFLPSIEEMFSASDMVKFAKAVPLPEANDEIWRQANTFVLNSWTQVYDNTTNQEIPTQPNAVEDAITSESLTLKEDNDVE